MAGFKGSDNGAFVTEIGSKERIIQNERFQLTDCISNLTHILMSKKGASGLLERKL